MYGDALHVMGVRGTETGADASSVLSSGGDPYTATIAEGLDLVGTLSDIGAGGPQKRERTARAMRDAAIAQKEAALAQLEAAKVEAAAFERAQAAAQAAGVPTVAGSLGGGGIVERLKGPSPIPGVPWWAVLAGAGVAAWALWPKAG